MVLSCSKNETAVCNFTLKMLKTVIALSACVLPAASREVCTYEIGGSYGFTLVLCGWTSLNDGKTDQLPACHVTHESVKLGTWLVTVCPSYFQVESSTLLFPYSSCYRYITP